MRVAGGVSVGGLSLLLTDGRGPAHYSGTFLSAVGSGLYNRAPKHIARRQPASDVLCGLCSGSCYVPTLAPLVMDWPGPVSCFCSECLLQQQNGSDDTNLYPTET